VVRRHRENIVVQEGLLGRVAGVFREADHPRSHGKFAEKPGAVHGRGGTAAKTGAKGWKVHVHSIEDHGAAVIYSHPDHPDSHIDRPYGGYHKVGKEPHWTSQAARAAHHVAHNPDADPSKLEGHDDEYTRHVRDRIETSGPRRYGHVIEMHHRPNTKVHGFSDGSQLHVERDANGHAVRTKATGADSLGKQFAKGDIDRRRERQVARAKKQSRGAFKGYPAGPTKPWHKMTDSERRVEDPQRHWRENAGW
jgi:hypothetical protein